MSNVKQPVCYPPQFPLQGRLPLRVEQVQHNILQQCELERHYHDALCLASGRRVMPPCSKTLHISLFFDGTGNNLNNDLFKPIPNPTNIVRLFRATIGDGHVGGTAHRGGEAGGLPSMAQRNRRQWMPSVEPRSRKTSRPYGKPITRETVGWIMSRSELWIRMATWRCALAVVLGSLAFAGFAPVVQASAIYGINHTHWEINRFSVDGRSGIDIIGPYQGGGGGVLLCRCAALAARDDGAS